MMRRSGGAALKSVRPRKGFAIATLAIGLVCLVAFWNQPALLRVGTLISLLKSETPLKLPVPVEEVAARDLADTWGAPRSGNRRHEGIDIFAPLGRPVLSTTKGVVFKVGEDDLGGHVVRVLGPGWQWHYYAHLDRFADIEPGSIVEQGSVIGYVGNTGNASGTPHHLHYGVYRFIGGARNPYPLLADDQPESTITKTARNDVKKVRNTRRSQPKKSAPPKKSKTKAKILRQATR
jgi:peptidoglycan LD-endopeptidase LytH